MIKKVFFFSFLLLPSISFAGRISGGGGSGGGGGGGSSTLAVEEGGVQISSPTAVINFDSADFSVTESPTGQANVSFIGSGGSGTPGLPYDSVQLNGGGVFIGTAALTMNTTSNHLVIGATTTFTSVSTTTWENAIAVSIGDGALLDMSLNRSSSTTSGIRIPQTVDCSSSTAEGQLCWDSDDDILWIGGSLNQVIMARDTLQAGATIYLTSGTILNLNTSTLKFSDGTTMTTAAVGGGGGGSPIAVGTGTASNFTTIITSPTEVVSFRGDQFGSLADGTTNFVSLAISTTIAFRSPTYSASYPYIQFISSRGFSNAEITDGTIQNYGGIISARDGVGGSGYVRLEYNAAFPQLRTTANNFTFLTSAGSLTFASTYIAAKIGTVEYWLANSASSANTFKTSSATKEVVVVKGFASQSANLQEWQDSSSNVLAYVTPNGNMVGDRVTSISTFTVQGSTLVLAGTTYYWQAGSGGAGKYLQNNNGVITSESISSSAGAIAFEDDQVSVNTAVSTVSINGVLKSTTIAGGRVGVFLNYNTSQFAEVASTFTALSSSFTMLGPTIDETDVVSVGAIAAGTLPSDVLVSSLPATSVTAGSYIRTNLTVDAQGRITAASNGSPGEGKPLEVFNNFDGTRSSPTLSISASNAFRGSVSGSTYTFTMNTSSVTLYGPNIPAASISAGSLGSSVLASSLTATGVTAGTYSNATITFDAQGRATSASNGSPGSSPVEVFNNFDGTRSSPTLSISASDAFRGTVSGSTYTFRMNTSSVTLYGPNIPAASIAAGSLGSGVIASSNTRNITSGQMANSDHGDVSWSNGVATVDNVAAANVAAGVLGASVRASSFPVSGVTAGSYTNASVTVNAQGIVTSASNGTLDGGNIPIEFFNNFDGTRSSPTLSVSASDAFRGTVSGSTYTFRMNTSSVTLYGPNIPAASISAGSLGASVLASSLTVTGVTAGSYTNADITIDAQGRITNASNGTIGSFDTDFSTGSIFSSTGTWTLTNTISRSTVTVSTITGIGTLTIPADALVTGNQIRIRMLGSLSCTGTQTFQVQLKIGTNTVVDSGAKGLGTLGFTNKTFDFESVTTVFKTGVGGNAMTQGIWRQAGPTTDAFDSMIAAQTSPVNINWAEDNTINLVFAWTAANASNIFTVTNYSVEIK